MTAATSSKTRGTPPDKTLGERFQVNAQILKAFCRAIGEGALLTDVSPEKVSIFLAGTGPLTASSTILRQYGGLARATGRISGTTTR